MISIITATYQDKNNLLGLIDSIRIAKRANVEWIVIDGGSTDGTLAVLETSTDVIDKFESEPDDGIYDAWNRGLKLSSGEYIVFLGADDRVSHDYFELALTKCDGSENLFLFPTAYVKESKTIRVVNASAWRKPRRFPVILGFPHSGTIHGRNLFFDGYFDKTYRIAGDVEFLIRQSNKLSIKHVSSSEPKVFFCLGGVSETVCRRTVYLELLKIYKRHRRKNIWFNFYILYLYIKLVIRLLMPQKIQRLT
jgi:glycosyltransferase involved in cell wall biosynthesis